MLISKLDKVEDINVVSIMVVWGEWELGDAEVTGMASIHMVVQGITCR